jgi:GTP cyclohydrolase I
VRSILQLIGEDPAREGLLETPERVVRSWDKLYGGYRMDPAEILRRRFCQKCDEMVLLKDIEFYSTCEHHMLPFFGKAHVAYLPDGGRVVGVSKLARLVECFARRLQIQERLTNQVASAITEHLQPLGVGVVVQAQHMCMTSRGVEKQNSIMVTSSLQGVFREDEKARREFLGFIDT